jgi:allantoin racemase
MLEWQMRLLVANANTSEGVTEIVAAEARRAASPGTEIVTATGAFGSRVIGSRADNAIAQHALLTLLADRYVGCDAVLIGVSHDTALPAAREMLPIPVVGMTEASLLTACMLGARFGLVTFGGPQLYRELVESYGLGGRLGAIRVIRANALDAYRDPTSVESQLAETAKAFADENVVDVIILCGAAMAGMPRRIQPHVPLPVIDGVNCGTRLCEMLAGLKAVKPRVGSYAALSPREVVALSPGLAAMFDRK